MEPKFQIGRSEVFSLILRIQSFEFWPAVLEARRHETGVESERFDVGAGQQLFCGVHFGKGMRSRMGSCIGIENSPATEQHHVEDATAPEAITERLGSCRCFDHLFDHGAHRSSLLEWQLSSALDDVYDQRLVNISMGASLANAVHHDEAQVTSMDLFVALHGVEKSAG